MATVTRRKPDISAHSGLPRVEYLPPQDLQAEACVLGCALLDAGVIDELTMILQPRMFYSDANGTIYSTVCDMHAQGQPIDAVTLAAEMERRGQLEEIGGPARLIELMEAVPFSAHFRSYAEEVRNAARRRGAVIAGMELCRRAHDLTTPTDNLLSDAETAIHSLMEDSNAERPVEIGELLDEFLREIRDGKPPTTSVLTGLDQIDQMTGGVPTGGLTIIAARPSMGKTALAVSLAITAAEAGANVLIVSYEMKALELTQRLLSNLSGVSCNALNRSSLDPNTCQRVMEAAARLRQLKIEIDCSNPDQSRLATLIRLQARRRTNLFIIDYLQLIEANDQRAVREQQVAGITRALKRVAMACDVPLILLSQLNREVEKRPDPRPRLSDLRESGAIEQDADIVMLLYRPASEDDFGILHIAKHRNGPTGEIKLGWDAPTMKFSADVTDPFRGKY